MKVRTISGLAVVAMTAISGQVHAKDAALKIVSRGTTAATILVSPDEAGTDGQTQHSWEKRAGEDLQKYIRLMSGVKVPVANTEATIKSALDAGGPLLVLGRDALKLKPELETKLKQVEKNPPVLRSDAIVLLREGNRVYLAGNNDDSQYYAVAELLKRWGCRWYVPTEFGECIPRVKELNIGKLDFQYAPPFEVRSYWLAWNGDATGYEEFKQRNMMNRVRVPTYHDLSRYVKDLAPAGQSEMQIAISDPKTIDHVVRQVEEKFSKGEDFSLSMEDGLYQSDDPEVVRLKSGIYDKYFRTPSMTEPFWRFYNGVAEALSAKYPGSNAKIGFLAYGNITLPPQRAGKAAKPLVMYLAPIDIDPNHGMNDGYSPARQEYREMMYRWAEKMQGKVAIYDYDQGNLVWRDLPSPSHEIFAQDVKHYRKAGILGLDTESRGATATTFLNLYFRGQLMWNPDADVKTMLAEFYPKFYGPAARPMRRYWEAIYDAWRKNPSTEHEYMFIPAVYTPSCVNRLEKYLAQAEAIVGPLGTEAGTPPEEKLLRERMEFTRQSFEVIRDYVGMTQAAAADCDFVRAVEYGEKGLAARRKLTEMNPTFTTTRLESGYAFWDGEVQQYRELAELTNGAKGVLIQKAPLDWALRRDPHDTGLAAGFAYSTPDLRYWQSNHNRYGLEAKKDYPTTEWEKVCTDLYAQAQGIRHPDGQSFTGYLWYKCALDLKPDEVEGQMHLMFPGLFNEAWLYVNGNLVNHRPFPDLWWASDYKFEWDVDVKGLLKPGANDITIRLHNPSHFGGIFRRPFLYRTKG